MYRFPRYATIFFQVFGERLGNDVNIKHKISTNMGANTYLIFSFKKPVRQRVNYRDCQVHSKVEPYLSSKMLIIFSWYNSEIRRISI